MPNFQYNYEYHPSILGFSESEGPLYMSLIDAKDKFGRYPSEFGLLNCRKGRKEKKSLNLRVGIYLTELLKQHSRNLKYEVLSYFSSWHRDCAKEFCFDPFPLVNINPHADVISVLKENKNLLEQICEYDARSSLTKNKLIRLDIINSIKPDTLINQAIKILNKKFLHSLSDKKRKSIQKELRLLRAREIVDKFQKKTTFKLSELHRNTSFAFADDAANCIGEINRDFEIKGAHNINYVRNQGIEFDYVNRDISFLYLGKAIGDCTSDKTVLQVDQGVENIYWTVFAWLLDRNYQILKVYYNGDLVAKVHLLPLYMVGPVNDFIFLAVDAFETVRAFRDDIQGYAHEELLTMKDEIFQSTMDFILKLADRMNIERVFAERFSNTRWVRNALAQLPEVYFMIDSIKKIDELEDIMGLARRLFINAGKRPPISIFMEIQMLNTQLLPATYLITRAKQFAIIRGKTSDGVPLKNVVTI